MRKPLSSMLWLVFAAVATAADANDPETVRAAEVAAAKHVLTSCSVPLVTGDNAGQLVGSTQAFMDLFNRLLSDKTPLPPERGDCIALVLSNLLR